MTSDKKQTNITLPFEGYFHTEMICLSTMTLRGALNLKKIVKLFQELLGLLNYLIFFIVLIIYSY